MCACVNSCMFIHMHAGSSYVYAYVCVDLSMHVFLKIFLYLALSVHPLTDEFICLYLLIDPPIYLRTYPPWPIQPLEV